MVTAVVSDSDTLLRIHEDIGKEAFILTNGILLGCVLLSGGIFYAIFWVQIIEMEGDIGPKNKTSILLSA